MPPASAKPKIAISACLMGAEVRFNGGHKESRLCSRTLTEYFDFVPVCPEVAIGLGIPRQPIRLVGDAERPEAIGTVHPELNVTRPLADYARKMAAELDDVCGYIFMQKSPSCGLERVKVYRANGTPVDGGGRGIYAQAFCAQHPNLPVEEDGRLNDPVLRENFLTRVFVYASWQQLLADGLSRHRLLAFHSRYKYLLMAHSPAHYKRLGHLLGRQRARGHRHLDMLARLARRVGGEGQLDLGLMRNRARRAAQHGLETIERGLSRHGSAPATRYACGQKGQDDGSWRPCYQIAARRKAGMFRYYPSILGRSDAAAASLRPRR